ncbi:MAG: TetR/AcrR family transcriptional regulator [Thermodesulfobacteriota bacterium]
MKKLNNKNLQSQETANRILNQAMRIFLEKGYHATSIDDITQAAGLTKGALYWHFKSKEDLLKKLIRKYEKGFLDNLIHAVTEVKGRASDKFEKYVRFNSAFAYYNRELCVSFTTLAAELVGAHHGIEPEIRRVYRKYQNFLSKLILQGKKEKIFRKEINAVLAALIVIAFHDGILLQWSMNREKIDGEAYVKTFKKIMLNGMMA